MIFLFLCLLTFQCPAYAKSSRTVHLSDGDLEPIYVEPGFSTIIKFESHPEPGLIGDQDGFKVEYLKNLVAIKPLIPKGKTNLFIFTKDGQFNFQLVASRGKHDNVVYAEKRDDAGGALSGQKITMSIDDLLTKRINKTVGSDNNKLTIESIAVPKSHATLVLRFSVLQKIKDKVVPKMDQGLFLVLQGTAPIKIENIFLERKKLAPTSIKTTGFILLRADSYKKNQNLTLKFLLGEKDTALAVSFLPLL